MKLPTLSPLWPWAWAVALVVFAGHIPERDEIDGELHDAVQAAKQERRKEMAAASFCIRTNGPSSRASWDADGDLHCSRPVATVAGGV